MVKLKGKTFENKKYIKQLGGRWDGQLWYISQEAWDNNKDFLTKYGVYCEAGAGDAQSINQWMYSCGEYEGM